MDYPFSEPAGPDPLNGLGSSLTGQTDERVRKTILFQSPFGEKQQPYRKVVGNNATEQPAAPKFRSNARFHSQKLIVKVSRPFLHFVQPVEDRYQHKRLHEKGSIKLKLRKAREISNLITGNAETRS